VKWHDIRLFPEFPVIYFIFIFVIDAGDFDAATEWRICGKDENLLPFGLTGRSSYLAAQSGMG